MTRPIVIVDPVGSGAELAPAFAARGVPAIAVRSMPPDALDGADAGGYEVRVHADHFAAIYDAGPDLVATLRGHDPLAVIAGDESGVMLADALAAALTPRFANLPDRSPARRHKAAVQAALKAAGLPHIRTLNTADAAEVGPWLEAQGLAGAALVLKPAESAGSDNVHHVPPGDDWRPAFDRILGAANKLRGAANETVVVQEMVVGTEYAVDTVSADGTHVLAHLIRYHKTSAGARMTVFDHTEFVPFDAAAYGELVAYVDRALDAVGIRWGAAHAEVMLTAQGPRLIEVGARTCGGPVLGFSRLATGSSQLERVVEAFVDGRIATDTYDFKQTVVPVFLIAPHAGVLRNVEVLDPVRELATHARSYIWRGNGARVPRTIDTLTSLGIIGLAGEREAVFADYARIRELEARLVIEPQGP